MRICFFYEGLRPGGVEHMIANLSHELLARGHQLTLVLAGSPTDQDHHPAPGTVVKWLHHPKKSARASIGPLRAELREGDYDILLSAMPAFNNAAVAARMLSGTRTCNVLTERTYPYPDYAAESLTQKLWHQTGRFFYPRAHAIVAVSAGLADALARFAHLRRETIDVIYNPAFQQHSYTAEDIAARAHPWTVDDRGPVLVSAGRLFPQKDFPTFLRAMAIVHRERPAVRAVILGDGPLRAELIALRDELGLSAIVDLPGFLPDINPSLQAAGFFVLSSAWEGFGNVLVEALGAGCSIVSTDCPAGPAEIMGRGRHGRLVPVGDAAAMAAAIGAMLATPADPAVQEERARSFSVSVACDQYEAVFRRVMAA
ncbi:glycosyltransferase [Sphingomonas sp. 3-13AW]|uniref:glycosyltransferase n=1 Tax=Sphingomonas sp. 3-13AW TaxID=3050450 RepID=UPI003BB5166C